MARSMTEDAVRDLAREALGLVDSEIARAGVGQLTTFNQLGFPGVADKPDGWYLPNNKNEVAVVLETKTSLDKGTQRKTTENELPSLTQCTA